MQALLKPQVPYAYESENLFLRLTKILIIHRHITLLADVYDSY
jgi:hypothetical protein